MNSLQFQHKNNQKREQQVVKSDKKTNDSTAKILSVQRASRKKGPADYGLVKPTLEDIPKPPEEMTKIDIDIANLVIDKIWNCIWYFEIAQFFMQPTKDELSRKVSTMTPQQRLNNCTNKATRHDYQICMELYKIPDIDTATDLSVLCLFDVIMLIDDSGSMNITSTHDMTGRHVPQGTEDYDKEEGANNEMSRWNLAELLVKVSAQVMTMFDDDGISVRFLNSYHKGDNIVDNAKVEELFNKVRKPTGGTPIGSAIINIYDELLRNQLTTCTLSKPVLIITYTDGVSSDSIVSAIKNIRAHTRTTEYGSKCVLFSFSQVGNDTSATEMLEKLDEDEDSSVGACDGAGDITDCTSSFKIEKAQFDKSQKSKFGTEVSQYTEIFYKIKGWVGPIMAKYDQADEVQKKTSIFGFKF